jgi:hypothetical protein
MQERGGLPPLSAQRTVMQQSAPGEGCLAGRERSPNHSHGIAVIGVHLRSAMVHLTFAEHYIERVKHSTSNAGYAAK